MDDGNPMGSVEVSTGCLVDNMATAFFQLQMIFPDDYPLGVIMPGLYYAFMDTSGPKA